MKIQTLLNKVPEGEVAGGTPPPATEANASSAVSNAGVTPSGQTYVEVNAPNPKSSNETTRVASTEQEVLAPKTNAINPRIPENIRKMEFSLDDSDESNAKNENIQQPAKETTEKPPVKPTTQTTEDDATSFEVEDATPKKPTVETIEGSKRQVPTNGPRDYTGFTPELAAALKRTGNDQFAIISKTLREQQEKLTKAETFQQQLAKEGMPERWYEHPQAFTLHPEFQQLSALHDQVRQELSYWQDQEDAIREKKPWKMLQGWSRDGKLVPGNEELSPEDKDALRFVQEKVRIGQAKMGEFAGGMQQIANNFGGRMAAIEEGYSKAVEKFFPWSKDEKDPRHKYVNQLYSKFPIELQNQYGTKIAAYLYAQLQKANETIRNQKSQLESKVFEQQETARIEPNIGTSPTGGAGSSNAPVKINGRVLKNVPAVFDLAGME